MIARGMCGKLDEVGWLLSCQRVPAERNSLGHRRLAVRDGSRDLDINGVALLLTGPLLDRVHLRLLASMLIDWIDLMRRQTLEMSKSVNSESAPKAMPENVVPKSMATMNRGSTCDGGWHQERRRIVNNSLITTLKKAQENYKSKTGETAHRLEASHNHLFLDNINPIDEAGAPNAPQQMPPLQLVEIKPVSIKVPKYPNLVWGVPGKVRRGRGHIPQLGTRVSCHLTRPRVP